SSDDGEDLQELTERQSGKRPQETQEIPVDNAQPIVPATSAYIAAVLAALKQTNEMLQHQSLRLDAVERNQR
ncbi:hypothetical protein A2U01_0109000, partial [Trifolium medium]|nr:hypothetical protein [Trifolium medium]